MKLLLSLVLACLVAKGHSLIKCRTSDGRQLDSVVCGKQPATTPVVAGPPPLNLPSITDLFSGLIGLVTGAGSNTVGGITAGTAGSGALNTVSSLPIPILAPLGLLIIPGLIYLLTTGLLGFPVFGRRSTDDYYSEEEEDEEESDSLRLHSIQKRSARLADFVWKSIEKFSEFQHSLEQRVQ